MSKRKPDIKEILELIKDEYERAKNLDNIIKKPIAYALYQIWRYADKEGI